VLVVFAKQLLVEVRRVLHRRRLLPAAQTVLTKVREGPLLELFKPGCLAVSAIVVGRDSRVSGPMFHRVVTGALMSAGCDVIDIGLVPTPTVQLAVEHHHAAGGLAITASHNPIEWNALKFIGPDGLFLNAADGAEMRATLEEGDPYVGWSEIGEVRTDDGAIDRHIDAILALGYIDVPGIRAHAYKVALDCCHGAGGAIIPKLLEKLGCKVAAIGLQTDGLFPRSPEPVAEKLGDLEQLVRESGAVVGFATDPDVDRLALVDETGKAIGEDFYRDQQERMERERPKPIHR